MLQRDVYPYEHIDDREKFSETSFTVKEDFCSHLKMKDIADADYIHAESL